MACELVALPRTILSLSDVDEIASCALRYDTPYAIATYRLATSDPVITGLPACDPASNVEWCCDVSSDQLPKKISTILSGRIPTWQVQDLGVLDVLQQIDAMPSENGHCHVVAHIIYKTIAHRIRQGSTDICGNFTARIHAANVGWIIHIINVFAVRNAVRGVMWHAVDKNTNSILFCASSKPALLFQLKQFYHGVNKYVSLRRKTTGLLAGPVKDWMVLLPIWKANDNEDPSVSMSERPKNQKKKKKVRAYTPKLGI